MSFRFGSSSSDRKDSSTPATFMNDEILNAVVENQVRNPYNDYADDSDEEVIVHLEGSPRSPTTTTYIMPPPGMKISHHYKKEETPASTTTPKKQSSHSRTNSVTSVEEHHSRTSSTCSERLGHFSNVPMLDEDEVKLGMDDTTKTRYGQMTKTEVTVRRSNDMEEDFHTEYDYTWPRNKDKQNNSSNNHERPPIRNLNISASSSFDQINTYTMLKILHTAHDFEIKLKELKERGMATVTKSKFDLKRLFKKYTDFEVQKYVWTYLTLLGLVGGLIVFVQDMVIDYMVIGRLQLIEQFTYISDESARYAVQMIMWIFYNLIFIVFSLLMTAWVAPSAEGSGIPAVKAILTGVDSLKDPISFKTLFIRVLCLPLVIGASMFVGRVGPVVAIGASLADNLLKLKIFKGIYTSKTLRAQMIACGCAMGIGANFGTPGGGVLFALEAIGTYYSLRTYIKSFYVAIIAAFTSRLLHSLADGTIYLPFVWHVNFTLPVYTIPDLFSFALLGIFLGLMGVLFVIINEKLLKIRAKIGGYYLGFFKFGKLNGKKYLYPLQNIFIWSILIAITTSVVTFPYLFGKFMSLSVSQTLESLFFGKQLLPENGAEGEWVRVGTNGVGYYGELFTNLSIFVCFRFALSFISVSLPIPAGIYLPLIVMGAGFGRLFGEFVHFLFQSGYTSSAYTIVPGGYAIVGAVAMSASATQAFSTVFILLEVAGAGVYLPSLMGAIIAVKISKALYLSIYDSIIKLKGWPALLEAQTDNDGLAVKDIMNYMESIVVFEESTTFAELENILQNRKFLPKTFPVVNSRTDMFLLGSISLHHLQDLYDLKRQAIEQESQSTQSHTTEDHNEEETTKSLSLGLLKRDQSLYMGWEPAIHHDGDQSSSSQQQIELQENGEKVDHKSDKIILDYQTCPVAISEDTPALIAHLLFSQLRIDDLFVVWMGRLIGQLHKEVLVKKVVESKE